MSMPYKPVYGNNGETDLRNQNVLDLAGRMGEGVYCLSTHLRSNKSLLLGPEIFCLFLAISQFLGTAMGWKKYYMFSDISIKS